MRPAAAGSVHRRWQDDTDACRRRLWLGAVAMLVSRRNGRLALVTQPDHAALAGWFAEHWGNEQFVDSRSAGGAAVCGHPPRRRLARARRPARPTTPQQQRPAHFTELPLTETRGSVRRAASNRCTRATCTPARSSRCTSAASTPAAGALGGGAPSDDPVAREVVATQEARWMPALREAWGYRGRRSEFDAAHLARLRGAPGGRPAVAGARADGLRASGRRRRADRRRPSTLAQVDLVSGPRFVTERAAAGRRPVRGDQRRRARQPRRVQLDPYPLR